MYKYVCISMYSGCLCEQGDGLLIMLVQLFRVMCAYGPPVSTLMVDHRIMFSFFNYS